MTSPLNKHSLSLATTEEGGSKKAKYAEETTPTNPSDPMAVVVDDSLRLLIFSFLSEEPKPSPVRTHLTHFNWMVSHVGKLYSTLRLVSPEWKGIFDVIVPWADLVGLVDIPIHAEVTGKAASGALSLIQWLCRYKIRLGWLDVTNFELEDVPHLIRLITECQTDKCSDVYLSVNKIGYAQSNARAILRPELGSTKDRPYPLVLPDIGAQKSPNFIGMPGTVALHATAQKTLHDAIALNCPILEHLTIPLVLPTTTPIYKDYISEALFSIPTITRLSVGLVFLDDNLGVAVDANKLGTATPVDGRIFSKLIGNLPKLQSLRVESSKSDEEHCQFQRFHIESSSLKLLYARYLSQDMVLSVDCPNLKYFYCDGGKGGGGCILPPPPSLEEFCRVVDYPEEEDPEEDEYYEEGYEFTGASMASPHFRVPDNCFVYLDNFNDWKTDDEQDVAHTYKIYKRRYNSFANASFQEYGDGDDADGEGEDGNEEDGTNPE